MGIKLPSCQGCEPDDKPFDHKHGYIGFRGEAVMTYMVDGVVYTDPQEAVSYVQETYETTRHEAIKFVFDLPYKVN